ncbi:peptide deformylase [Candidatus Saccharibacteria bacterium]|nr:MAG: peptide deformylase [Candidatus Saccharibacteria bacterium]
MTANKDSIITLPNQHLRQRSQRIGVVTKATSDLVKDMVAAVIDWDASRDHEVTVALAAVQIDQLYRVVIVREDFNHETPAQYTTLINPEIVKLEGEIERDYEGCLSIRSVYGYVPRHTKVRIKALDANGKPIKFSASGFLARVLQHEIDHTNGKLFVDHIKDDHEAFFELTNKGKLEPLDYEKDIKNSRILWQ